MATLLQCRWKHVALLLGINPPNLARTEWVPEKEGGRRLNVIPTLTPPAIMLQNNRTRTEQAYCHSSSLTLVVIDWLEEVIWPTVHLKVSRLILEFGVIRLGAKIWTRAGIPVSLNHPHPCFPHSSLVVYQENRIVLGGGICSCAHVCVAFFCT